MRKLAIAALLVMAGCKRQVAVSSAPSQPSATANPNVPGGSSHRDALARFLQSARQQDVQAMSNIWGTPTRGAARTSMGPEELEMRIIYMMKCLRHDSSSVLTETPAVGDKRLFATQLKYRTLTAISDFTTTRGPDNRYYVQLLDLEKLNVICTAQ